MKRYFYAFLLGLPGVAIGLMGSPNLLGEGVLAWGLLLAIICPVIFLVRNPA